MTEGPVMPVGIIVFGDKSHTDLHGTLSLTPIIFTLTLFNRSHVIIHNFGDQLATSLICPMEGYRQQTTD